MKGNIHKKTTFDDGDGKRYIRSDLRGWAQYKRINRRLSRRSRKIVNKTFLRQIENLGYDVELTNVKRTSEKSEE